MYKIIWDKDSNGILLVNSEGNSKIINSPRPVFFEELDLLGFNEFWEYPKVQEPLLWAIGRGYYYKGELVAKVKGGNIFEPPNIEITEKGQNLSLKPIDIKELIEKNKEALFVLENEALDFIEHTYKVYKKKNYLFAISYSGGKDSQVILDLVTRVIPPDDLVVVFSDTKMELSFTYKSVERTEKEYKKRYPKLEFLIAEPSKLAIEFWKEFGPPSRIHRWCTTVLKTAPFINQIKNFLKNNATSKITVFEGVRAEESNRRSCYQRIAKKVKHFPILNARPILYWNFTEVILYIFLRDLEMNFGYRLGLTRIGCSICPFSSEWSEYIISKIKYDPLNEYIKLLKKYSKAMGLKEEKDINEYIAKGQWKKRAGGRGLKNINTINFSIDEDHLKAVMINPRENFLEWIKVVGDILCNQKTPNNIYGELKTGNRVYSFILSKDNKKEIVEFYNINDNIDVLNKIKRVLYKSTFCIHCGACKAECPTGALKITSHIQIDNDLCTHCGNCIYFINRGCLVSNSIYENVGGVSMNKRTGGIDRYSTFGLREEWLSSFLNFGDQWLEKNNLGPKQIFAVLHWFIDAELLDPKTKKSTPLGNYLRRIYPKNNPFIWSIIWNNLYYNSSVVRWYCDHVDWGTVFIKKELKEKIALSYPNLSKGTLSNSIDALINTFDRSSLGNNLKIGLLDKKGNIVKFIRKIGTDDIHPLAVAYSLYKAAEYTGRRDFTVSELYSKEFEGGPYKLFGISRDKLERILRGLQEDKEQMLRVDLVADLDNIYLREDLSSLDIIKIAEGRLK